MMKPAASLFSKNSSAPTRSFSLSPKCPMGLNRGRPVSQEELIDHVWDNSVDGFSNAIRVHISALRKKLRAAMGYDPIHNRIGEGYLLGGPEE